MVLTIHYQQFNIFLNLHIKQLQYFFTFRQNKLIPEDCPFSYEQVVEQVIDDFNQMLEDHRTKEGHPLSEDKKSEYRDLRRRGKNRVSI